MCAELQERNPDGPRDGALDRELRLIALEHNPGKDLEHLDQRAGTDAKASQALGANGEVAGHAHHPAAAARTECR